MLHVALAVLLLTGVVSVGNVEEDHGFCENQTDASPTFTFLVVLITAEIVICLSIVLTSCILTYCYIKKNTIEENTAIKKAVAKTLLYNAIKMSLLVSSYVLGSLLFFVNLDSAFGSRATAFIVITVYYIAQLLYRTVSLLTPIISLLILKPLRDAFGEMKKMCCCKGEVEQPTQPQNNALQETQI